MRLPTIFKQHRNKTFDYYPRYYDERKERLEKIKAKYRDVESSDNSEEKFVRRSSYRDSWARKRNEKVKKNAEIRLVLILVLMVVATYKLFTYLGISFF